MASYFLLSHNQVVLQLYDSLLYSITFSKLRYDDGHTIGMT
jgi:hypothetical protein